MMNFRCIMTTFAAIIVSFLICSEAYSFVSQGASNALRGDNFVGDNNSSRNKNQVERKAKDRVKTATEKEAERKADIISTQKAIVNGANSVKNKNCPNAQTIIKDNNGKTLETITSSNYKYKREQAIRKLEQMGDYTYSASKKDEKINKIEDIKKTDDRALTNGAEASLSPERTTAPAVDYNKHYASKLFSTLSGHITIEQKNIPKRIGITQGSTIQLNLKNDPNTLWFFELDNKVAKIKSDKANGDQRTVIIETVGKGNTKMILDYLSTKTSEYKVILSKRMLIMVD